MTGRIEMLFGAIHSAKASKGRYVYTHSQSANGNCIQYFLINYDEINAVVLTSHFISVKIWPMYAMNLIHGALAYIRQT